MTAAHPDPRAASDPPAPELDPDVAAVLQDPAALWAAVQEASGEYVALVDRAGIIRGCNRVDEGFTLDQVVGHAFTRFTLPESARSLQESLEHVLTHGEVRTLETTVRRLDGSLNYFALRIAPVRRAGRTVALLVCCQNIRPLKTTEQALTHERNVLKRLLEIQERERQLVSYEIHDGIAQYLAGALMHLQAYQHACPPEAAREFDEGLRLLQAAAEESRRLIGGLRPPALDELGLVDAIQSLVDEARLDVDVVTFAHHLPGERLAPQLETTIFRIAQEAITNARKHARAGRLQVELTRTADGVRIVVADDGRGFDPAAVPEDRFGLEGIRQRAQLLGGTPRITTAIGRGTTIDVTLPPPGA